MATTNTVTAAGELLSSIAAVRQLLLQNHHQPSHKYADDLSMVQQSRYEDRLKFEEEQKSQKELLDDLTVRLEQARHEAQQEKAIRESLEATNEALEKHKEELSVQLETLSSSRPSLFESQEHDSIPLASVQALEQEKNDLVAKWTYSQKEIAEIKVTSDKWRSQCLASQRQVKELQIQLETFKKEYQMSQDRHKELLQGGDTKYESFHRRLEESVAARKKAEQELQAIIRKSSSTADSNVSQKASSQSQEPSREEQQQKLIEVTQKCDEADKARVAAEDKVSKNHMFLSAFFHPLSNIYVDIGLLGTSTRTGVGGAQAWKSGGRNGPGTRGTSQGRIENHFVERILGEDANTSANTDKGSK